MADAVELAVAYIQIVPSMKDSQGTILKELMPEAESAGEAAGEKSGGSFKAGFGKLLGVAGALGLGAMFASGFATAVEGSDAKGRVAASMGLTAEESARVGDVSGRLFADAYGESLGDVTNAVGAVIGSMDGMRDASEESLARVAGKAMDLATAFEVDIAEASNTVGILIRNGLAADADEAMDLIAGSMQQIPTAIQGEVLPVMDEYAKHFAALGIDGPSAMNMIVAASADGAIGMDKMGDALKEFTIRATDGSTATVEAFDMLGLSSDEMQAKLLAGGPAANEAMGQIVTALRSIDDPGQQAAAALALFGTPLEDLGTDKIPTFLAQIDPLEASIGDFGGTMDGVRASLETPGESLERLSRSFGQIFTSVATMALPAVEAFTTWASGNEWIWGVLATAIGVGLVVAFGAWAASIWAANAALLANPITWVVLAIAGLIAGLVALIANWDAVAAWLSGVWQAVVDGVVAGWNWLVEIFTSAGAAIAEKASAAWEAVKGFFASGVAAAVEFAAGLPAKASAALASLQSYIGDKATAAWNWVKTKFTEGVTAAVNFARELPGKASTAIADLKNAIGQKATEAWEWLKTKFNEGITAAVNFAKELPLKSATAILDLKNQIGQKATEAWEGLKAKFNEGITAAVNLAKELPGKAAAGLGNVGSTLVNAGRSLVNGFLDGIKQAWGRLTSWVRQGMDNLRGLWPFSPAKWGPFSGRGYVTHSGKALVDDFAGSLLDGQSTVEDAAYALMSSANITPSLALAGAAPGLNVGTSDDIGSVVIEQLLVDLQAIEEIPRLIEAVRDARRMRRM
ncbi:MAG: hypothetical protein Q4G35_03235 [Propionibacteriaceae bacterium]|nr:hypothetical protein [Propionibacteriaceae bacterium]